MGIVLCTFIHVHCIEICSKTLSHFNDKVIKSLQDRKIINIRFVNCFSQLIVVYIYAFMSNLEHGQMFKASISVSSVLQQAGSI